jgi:predicted RNase H-like HicB family nuclease
MKLTAAYKKVGDWWTAWVEEIPGVNTKGATLEEARENLRDARSAWFWKLIASYQKRNRKQLDARTWWLLETRRSVLEPTIKPKSPEAKVTTLPYGLWPLNGSASCLPAGKIAFLTTPIDTSKLSKDAVQNTPKLPPNTHLPEPVNKTVNNFKKY